MLVEDYILRVNNALNKGILDLIRVCRSVANKIANKGTGLKLGKLILLL